MDSMEGPGVSGDHISVGPEPIDPARLAGLVAAPAVGAVAVFLGTVRDHAPGRTGVTRLEYEAYPGVVEAKIAEVVSEARARWPLQRAVVVHRVGSLAVGEISVGVAVGAAHRPEAFEAARYLIDEVKARAPIWKKEHWPGGSEWVREDREHGSVP
jgi:molybdopterin synthase catalytic subunit